MEWGAFFANSGFAQLVWQQGVMIVVALLLIYLAIGKKFEPLLLLPIGMGALLANLPDTGLTGETGFLTIISDFGLKSGLFPLLIFMGIGAFTDFGPMLANPKTLFLGAAAQLGIFLALLSAIGLTELGLVNFSIKQAAAIGIIGGADGPTAIYVSGLLAPDLLGSIAVAAYSYMALVPLIQPPVMRLLTTKKERKIKMVNLRHITKLEKILFPLLLLLVVAFFVPSAAPLVGVFCFGNLANECGLVDRLSGSMKNELINIVTILLGLAVGSKLQAEHFLTIETLGILALGVVAFVVGTASGVLMAKFMNLVFAHKVNPLIGSAGVSAVPMAARVSNKLGLEADPHNFLLMHAMGPNVAGVIGSAIVAGIMISYLS